MTSSTASTATPLRSTFEQRVEAVKASKSDINAVILDYLLAEGYPTSAANFSREANLRPLQEEQSTKARQSIIRYIHSGNIQAAIEALNDLEPMVLDNDPALHFALLRLQLVELIRTCNASPSGDITPALTFATNELAPRAPTNPKFLEDLEKTMALLVFPADNLEPELANLLSTDLRRFVAEWVNQAVLESENQRKDAAIRKLSCLRMWAENQIKENDLLNDVPSIGLFENETWFENETDTSRENEHDAMGVLKLGSIAWCLTEFEAVFMMARSDNAIQMVVFGSLNAHIRQG